MKYLFAMLIYIMFLQGNASNCHSSDLPNTFKNYKEVRLKNGGNIYLSPNISYKLEKTGGPEFFDYFLIFELGQSEVKVQFEEGPSYDPGYIFYMSSNTDIFKGYLSANEIIIDEFGFVYSISYTNQYFLKKAKYIIDKDGIREIKQPFYSVNRSCDTNGQLILTTKPCSEGEVIAQLPKGTFIKVLLARDWDYLEQDKWCKGGEEISFLVETQFGLIGWADTKPSSVYGTGGPIPCIYYQGD